MQGIATSVFVDANVHFSRTRRDWIGLLSTTPDDPLFHVYWTEDIVAEVIRNLRKKYPEWSGGQITDIRRTFDASYEGYRVDDFVIDGTYRGTDPKDAHVHAAATACSADYLVTENIKDFVWDDQSTCYEVLTTDAFLCLVAEANNTLIRDVTLKQLLYWYRRDGKADLPEMLRRDDCPEFAKIVRQHLQSPSAREALRDVSRT